MEEAPCRTRDTLEDCIARLLDVRDDLATLARAEDKRARNRLVQARRRTLAPTKHKASAPPAQRSA